MLTVCEAAAAEVPVVLMVYANVVLAAGLEEYAARAAAAGASGLIVPDLPHDEAGELRAACDAQGLALVPLVAPTTTPERLAAIGADARGFVYTVSLMGTTGERTELPPELAATVQRVRARHEAAGGGRASGSRRPSRRARWPTLADGVIVGSRVVRAAAEGGADGVSELIAGLRRSLL